MESSPKPTVTFDSNDQIFNTDSTEDLENYDEDITQTETRTLNLSKTSSVVRSDGGDMNSISSISTSILDDVEEVRLLKRRVAEAEEKCKLLEFEVERSNCCLINERNRNAKLEKKLQFVKDNQEVFIRLKEAYINMKYNEAAGRKMIEIREKGLQTWEGILCRGCIEAEELRRQMETVKEKYKDSCIVAPFEVEQLVNTVKYLKDLIDRREKSWAFNADRDNKLQTHIKTLEMENSALRDLIQNRDIYLEDNQNEDGMNQSEMMTIRAEITQLKKIIIKYEKKIREFEKSDTGDMKLCPSLNHREKKIVQQLMTKFNSRMERKSRSASREPKLEPGGKLAPGRKFCRCINRCSNHLDVEEEIRGRVRCLKPRNGDRINSNASKLEKNPDAAIMMMDYLFETESNNGF
ncbi:uncharacterized protein [Leptinotarsa decemlineata]|uniref:uncharacterized protein n=1 Tax=Leptinotarsa decemlineata TaxID=7539 RepID=UPI003D30D2C3